MMDQQPLQILINPHACSPNDTTAVLESLKQEYFRSGPYTYLHLLQTPDTIAWTFTFMDLGLCHTIKSTHCITIDTYHTIHVDGKPQPSTASARSAVFGGRYAQRIRELYDEMGIEPIAQGV
jgi:hypothetical protein